MKYISTRGGDRADNFEQVVLAGLAADGGLFVPETYPVFSADKIRSFKGMAYHELAYEVISPYVETSIGEGDLKRILKEVYCKENFQTDAIAPLTKLYENHYLLELFHGPTLAFKDFALQLLGRFFDFFLSKTGETINILGATSGDTGSAAIAGCAPCKNVNVFILHPQGKVSEVQRRQMTTILGDNVHNIAVKGTFDDCQNIVKSLFSDLELKKKYGLSAVNSINWARIVAQVVYYFYVAVQLGAPEKSMSFSVPTGNFGDILAGWIARKMGLPIDKLIIATNSNDILYRFMQDGVYKKLDVVHTITPSMDIQISSNFERLLFEYYGRDASVIAAKQKQLKQTGEFSVDEDVLNNIRKLFGSQNVKDEVTKQVIGEVFKDTGEVLDPHSAIGYKAAKEINAKGITVTLATAHPAKFPDAVKEACGVHPELPAFLSDLFERKEEFVVSDNKLESIRQILIDANS